MFLDSRFVTYGIDFFGRSINDDEVLFFSPATPGSSHVDPHREQQEQHPESEEDRSEQGNEQFLEDDSFLTVAAAAAAGQFRPGHLEHEEPRREEGPDEQQHTGQMGEHGRVHRRNVANHWFHDVLDCWVWEESFTIENNLYFRSNLKNPFKANRILVRTTYLTYVLTLLTK